MLQVKCTLDIGSFADICALVARHCTPLNLSKLLVESVTTLRIANLVLTEATYRTVLSPHLLVLAVQFTLPYQLLVASTR